LKRLKVLLLAAGYGTRLYPYTRDFPKPLLEVNGRPIVDYLIDKLDAVAGIEKAVVVTNARFFRQFCAWKKGLSTGFEVTILNDKTTSPANKLGAIRDMQLAFLRERYRGDFLVMGGDNFFEEPLSGFMAAAGRNAPLITIGVADVKSRKQAAHFGVVTLDRRQRVIGFQEKPQRPKSTLIGMCLYFFPEATLRLVDEYLADPRHSRDTLGSYIQWLSGRRMVCAKAFRKTWLDIGTHSTYRKVKEITSRKE
jgi:glucose-1-phosphate thymidylyltransferase